MKLMGLNFIIQYKKGRENEVANSLSRRENMVTDLRKEGEDCTAITEVFPQWIS